MPSKQQNRVLLGLESGVKLQDLLREPGMPRLDAVQEWINNNPEFDRLYTEATEKGRTIRLAKFGKSDKEPAAHQPSVLRGNVPPNPDRPGRALSEKLTAAIGDGDTYNSPDATAPPAAGFVLSPLQALVLQKLREGHLATPLLKHIPGYGGVKLAAWRKNPEFVRLYDEAKAAGALLREQQASPTESTEPTPLVFAAPQQAEHLEAEALDVDFVPNPEAEEPAATPEAEPAPNQSEPAPDSTVRELTRAEQWKELCDELNVRLAAGDIAMSDYVLVVSNYDVAAARQMLEATLKRGPELRAQAVAQQSAATEQQQAAQQKKRMYATVLGVQGEQRWMNKKEALGDAEYRALTSNRPCFVVEVLTEVAPAVTVREL